MSYNDISAYQALILNVVKFLEEQESSKIKVSFFKGNNFFMGIPIFYSFFLWIFVFLCSFNF